LSLRSDFEKFHEAHPEVYVKLVEIARETKARGYKKYSVRTIWEVLRWRIQMLKFDAKYKLNDHHSPYYSRLIAAQEPDLVGFFEQRTVKEEYA